MRFRISRENSSISGTLRVPASKSISNRLLIIQALCPEEFTIENLSDSEDTRVLKLALSSGSNVADIGHAGTSMRFLTAFFASQQGEKILTGSSRMKERPIGKLVDALLLLGAEIEYVENEGFPPLRIKGKQLDGGKIKIDSSVSSQFVSALLLSSPGFKKGLELELENKIISSSYIDMTLRIMEHAGVSVSKSGNILVVKPQQYRANEVIVEGDWSGVSYWYEMAAFSEKSEISILSLHKKSFQGDAACAAIFKNLGIETEYSTAGIKITNSHCLPTRFDFDFIENPDLVQTLAVTCVMLNIPFCFKGTETLRIKETDRITALQLELAKFGASLIYNNGTLEWNGIKKMMTDEIPIIATYHDHRMALAFAPIALLGKDIIIDDPMVVIKSYPKFWDDLKTMGFKIEEM